MSNAVRPLDPTGPTPTDGNLPPPGHAAGGPRWLGAIVGGLAVFAAVAFLIRPSSPPVPPPFEPIQPPAPTALASPSYATPAVGVFGRFVTLIDQGAGDEAISLMVDELPDVLGVGTSEYPQSPSDAKWWTDGRLNPDNVTDFAGYVHTVPGSVSVTGCEGFADGPRVVVVSCDYTSTGGVLAALGHDPEGGRLFGIMIDERVAGVIRNDSDRRDVQIWHRLASWAAINRPEVQLRAPILAGAGWKLDPVYSSASAGDHQALALELAASTRRSSRLRQ